MWVFEEKRVYKGVEYEIFLHAQSGTTECKLSTKELRHEIDRFNNLFGTFLTSSVVAPREDAIEAIEKEIDELFKTMENKSKIYMERTEKMLESLQDYHIALYREVRGDNRE